MFSSPCPENKPACQKCPHVTMPLEVFCTATIRKHMKVMNSSRWNKPLQPSHYLSHMLDGQWSRMVSCRTVSGTFVFDDCLDAFDHRSECWISSNFPCFVVTMIRTLISFSGPVAGNISCLDESVIRDGNHSHILSHSRLNAAWIPSYVLFPRFSCKHFSTMNFSRTIAEYSFGGLSKALANLSRSM